jgi:hypothetical protein
MCNYYTQETEDQITLDAEKNYLSILRVPGLDFIRWITITCYHKSKTKLPPYANESKIFGAKHNAIVWTPPYLWSSYPHHRLSCAASPSHPLSPSISFKIKTIDKSTATKPQSDYHKALVDPIGHKHISSQLVLHLTSSFTSCRTSPDGCLRSLFTCRPMSVSCRKQN